MTADVDVLVIGSGACGLAAAIAAHDCGADVAIIEKLDRAGGNSALSTGSVPAAGTRFQREAGIDDSTERFVEDLMRKGGPTDCPDLLHRLVETSADTVEWLVDSVGARMTLVTAYKHVGHSVPRLHAPASPPSAASRPGTSGGGRRTDPGRSSRCRVRRSRGAPRPSS